MVDPDQFLSFHGVFWMTDPLSELTSHIPPFTGSSENHRLKTAFAGMGYVDM